MLAIDDQSIARIGLKAVLGGTGEFEVVGECGGAQDALALAERLSPRVIVLDLLFPTAEGFTLIRDLRVRAKDSRILVWSLMQSASYVSHCLQLGALGFIAKTASPEQLIRAVRRVAEGKIYVDEEQAGEVLTTVLNGGQDCADLNGEGAALHPALKKLSNAEFQVLHLIGLGNTTRDIAKSLHRSPKTIETYRSRIRGKLGLHNPTELAQLAWRVVHSEQTSASGRAMPSPTCGLPLAG